MLFDLFSICQLCYVTLPVACRWCLTSVWLEVWTITLASYTKPSSLRQPVLRVPPPLRTGRLLMRVSVWAAWQEGGATTAWWACLTPKEGKCHVWASVLASRGSSPSWSRRLRFASPSLMSQLGRSGQLTCCPVVSGFSREDSNHRGAGHGGLCSEEPAGGTAQTGH